MALVASKVSASQVVSDRISGTDSFGVFCSFSKSLNHIRVNPTAPIIEYNKLSNEHLLGVKLSFLTDGIGRIHHKSNVHDISRVRVISCMSTGTRNGETTECARKPEKNLNTSRNQNDDGDVGNGSTLNKHRDISRSNSRNPSQGLADASNVIYNDAKFVNERARNDIFLLSREITRLNDRARQDVAVLGMGFLKLDARARKDTEKIDNSVKKKAARLHHIATILKDRAQSKLKTAADQHWSDGALEADLRRADYIVRRRAMEDAFMALQFVKNIHDMMVKRHLPEEDGSFSVSDVMDYITLERNGKAFDLFPGEVSTDRIVALQEAYWSMASALSEADGIDYTDPEELELLVATLIDLDAMDGKSSVSLLAECSSSPDVNTRKALANALAAAPSMWTLGNAGMGALQRLAEDSNPAVAAAASNAIDELRRQWEVQEGDSLTFRINQSHQKEDPDGTTSEIDSS